MIPVDGHVHLHDSVEIEAFLTAAWTNFRHSLWEDTPVSVRLKAMLCLADYGGAEGFARLRRAAADRMTGIWRIDVTDDDFVLMACHPNGDRLWLVGGRQVITAERIEVLALCTTHSPVADSPLTETIREIADLGALSVLPWGAGKWWGQRGRVVRAALADPQEPVLAGDNGGRPGCWEPRLLAAARRRCRPIIPGSDPLPIPGDRFRCGGFGLVLEDPMDERHPGNWLKSRLAALPADSKTFGRPLPLSTFLKCQWALRRGKFANEP